MKLDRCDSFWRRFLIKLTFKSVLRYSDGSGSIDREEFLQIPQIATNPLASRMIAIFDEEYVFRSYSYVQQTTKCFLAF